jgi:hypothetical protein
VGAAAFLVGGKFLYEIKHIDFFTSEAIGIPSGVLLAFLGVAITPAKRSKAKQHID